MKIVSVSSIVWASEVGVVMRELYVQVLCDSQSLGCLISFQALHLFMKFL